MKSKGIDMPLLSFTVLLVIAGFLIFVSASMGLLARENMSFTSVAAKQFLVGFIGGGITLIAAAKVPYKWWRKASFYLLIVSILSCVAVFLPRIGFEHGGAKRWLNLGFTTFQPAELLKLGMVIYFAAWISAAKDKIRTFKMGALPLFVLIAVSAGLLMKQPDTGTFMVVFFALVAMFIAAGGKWRYMLILFVVCAVGILVLAQMRPYLKARFVNYLDPSRDSLGSGYQLQQSLIAIGSGQAFGRGFGQSVQKFNFLPEPIGDSIFAVASEEFGFVGAVLLVLLFLLFALRGFKVASRVPDTFGAALTVGIMTLIVSQAFINIASMLGILPLTGIPLTFVSHGGTALFFALAEVGIVLNISKHQKA